MGFRCALCDETIPKGSPYFHATTPHKVAATLVDHEAPALAPAMHRATGGTQLSFCTTCAGELVDVSVLTPATA